MKNIFTKILLPLAPALCIFGPFNIAIGIDGPLHLWAIIGAFMTGIGFMLLFLKVMEQSKQIDNLTHELKTGGHP
jgi:hypothetical protein